MREYLYDLRTAKGLTCKQVGEACGISESYYYSIEQGDKQKKMKIDLAWKLAAALGVSVDDIVRAECDE